MKTKCPKTGCGRIYPIPEEAAGKKVRCKKCGTSFYAHPWTPPKPRPEPRAKPAPPPPEAKKESEKLESRLASAMAVVFMLAVAVGVYWAVQDDPKPKPKPAVAQKASPKPKAPPPPKVQNSAWDGGVWQVEDWLEDRLKDPDSVDYIDWSPVVKVGDGYAVRCKYRAKNSYGGYVIAEQYFRMDADGNVVSAQNVRR